MRLTLACLGTALLGIGSLFISPRVLRLPAAEAVPHFQWYGVWLAYLRLFAIPLLLVALGWTYRKPVIWMKLFWGLGFALVSLAALVEIGPENSEIPWLMLLCFVLGLSVVVSALLRLKPEKVPPS